MFPPPRASVNLLRECDLICSVWDLTAERCLVGTAYLPSDYHIACYTIDAGERKPAGAYIVYRILAWV